MSKIGHPRLLLPFSELVKGTPGKAPKVPKPTYFPRLQTISTEVGKLLLYLPENVYKQSQLGEPFMNINIVSILQFPQNTVFEAYRDNLVDLVDYLPNISKIEIAKREEPQPHVVKFENHWYAQAPIPKMAQAFIKPEMLKWIDYAEWNHENFTCDWKIETFFMREAVTCKGQNKFRVLDDNSMELTIGGNLSIDTKKVPGIPRLLAGKIKPQIEKFIIALITPNFHKINSGIEQFLRAQS